MDSLGQSGTLQVISPQQLEQQIQARAAANAAFQTGQSQDVSQLVAYIKGQFEIFRNHRNTQSGWSERLLVALRTFKGQYDATKLAEIRKFGGSEVYLRLVSQKCRAATSLLRDIYLGTDRCWALRPPDDPDVPEDVFQQIDQLIQSEAGQVAITLGQPPAPADLQKRREELMLSAMDAARVHAAKQAKWSEDKVEEILREGGFYHALAEFLVDLPIFPFACIKGPVVRVVPTVIWPKGGGRPTIQMKPTLTWNRVNPFDLWWTPGVSDIANANMIEKLRITRAELNELLDLPGYNRDEVYAVLDEYGRGGLYDNWDTTDAERSVLENLENPMWNRSALISMMEFNGNVQGRVLQDYGLAVPDELRDYHVQVWAIGNHVIKAHLSPSPRMRHPYFITSYEKVPGTPVGNGLTDLLTDMQECSNATLRALINNLSIASGPQVVIDDDRLAPNENGEDMFPWKRWHVRRDPFGNGSGKSPIEFFQPQDFSDKLLKVIDKFVELADDVSAIPKYIGGQASSGAGRTASGLAMLMGNASKILQSVSANVDRDVMENALLQLVDLILLTDTTGLLNGEERVTVLGVNVAMQRETQRQRQLEFLQHTANPLDMKIIQMKGRGKVLRAVSTGLGLPGEDIVPDDEALERMQQQQEQQAQDANIMEKVNEGVDAGVKAGVQRITAELTAGVLAPQEGMTEGPPAHIGTPGGPTSAGGPAVPSQPGGPAQPGSAGTGGPGKPVDEAARQASGIKPEKMVTNHMGPQTALVGNQRGPGAVGIQGGAT
jgi:hypothetical protein